MTYTGTLTLFGLITHKDAFWESLASLLDLPGKPWGGYIPGEHLTLVLTYKDEGSVPLTVDLFDLLEYHGGGAIWTWPLITSDTRPGRDVLWPKNNIDLRLFDGQHHPILDQIAQTPLVLENAHSSLHVEPLPSFAKNLPDTPWKPLAETIARNIESHTPYSIADFCYFCGLSEPNALLLGAVTWLSTNRDAVFTVNVVLADGTILPSDAIDALITDKSYSWNDRIITANDAYLSYQTGLLP